MLGLQGKSAKPAPRAPFSKSGSGTSLTMASHGPRSRASSSSSEKPERLTSGPSPYSVSLTGGTIANRRVQSAVSFRQRSSLCPTIKASELFRKNSESQLPNKREPPPTLTSNREDTTSQGKLNRSKHVRIGPEILYESPPPKSRFTTSASMLKGRSTSAQDSGPRRRPFSFSSDRSRSVSVASNDSIPYESDNNQPETIIGSGNPSIQWQRDYENNNEEPDAGGGGDNLLHVRPFPHPRLNKRSYSMENTILSTDYMSDYFGQEFNPQTIEMKIAEHPDESLKEDNVNLRRRYDSGPSQTEDDVSSNLNSRKSSNFEDRREERRTPETTRVTKGSNFDRLLLMHSDNILQDVSDLINEIKSHDASKPVKVHDLVKVESVEKLVDEMKNDVNRQRLISSLDDVQHQALQLSGIDGCFNSLELSGVELSDITCPQQVMEQSVPNSSRLERPLSAVFLGNSDILTEADNYLLSVKASGNDGEIGVSTKNSFWAPSEALATIQQQANDNNSGGASSSTSNNAFDMTPEEIQRKLCSALRLLEEEERKGPTNVGSGRFSRTTNFSGRTQSPFASVSNPDSRSDSRMESCKSSPRLRSDDRSMPYEKNSRGKQGFESMECIRRGQHEFSDTNDAVGPGNRSARSCSCLVDHRSTESVDSARSVRTTVDYPNAKSRKSETARLLPSSIPRLGSRPDEMWETKDIKTKQIFSFLDEVEKSDQEILFGLRFDSDSTGRPKTVKNNTMNAVALGKTSAINFPVGHSASDEKHFRTLDGLMRKGPVELAREILLLERNLDEAQHAVKLLEESLLNQRELNIRHLRNSEKDFKKRMRMQKEEFDLAFSRNEALITEMASEKRVLQEKLDKMIKNFEEMEEKHKEQHKVMQQKHLDEIRRLRKMQQNAEQSLKQKIAGNRAQAQEIREMTVKGLEPEVQRIIQRHQQEMSEMRAWHADEVRETEERLQRKLHMQLEDMREKFNKEKEDLIVREREHGIRRMETELKQKDDEIEHLKRRLANDIFEERERAVSEEVRLKESLQESVRKAQIKGEVELDNLKQEYDMKIANLERRHEGELKSLKDVFEAEKQNLISNHGKKVDNALAEQEIKLRDAFQVDKEKEWREKERKLKDEFEKLRKDDEAGTDSRFRRMQEKLHSELSEMEKSEKDLKCRFSQSKSDLLAREEEVFSLKASVGMKDKQLIDLQEINMKMQEERVNLTSVIRREFLDQIQSVEEECRTLKASIVELQSNAKLQSEQKLLEIERVLVEKDTEIEKIGLRVKQTLTRKDETILELQKQLDKCSFQISHLEELLEEQRKEFLQSMKMPANHGAGGSRKK